MSDPRLPPEISDYIVDFLHDQPEALKQCCLVSKSWVPRTQKYLFGKITLRYPVDFEEWKETFPVPAKSPSAKYTHSLTFRTPQAIISVVEEGGSWIRTVFCNVVRLELSLGSHSDPSSRFHISTVVYSLPRIEDLVIGRLKIASEDDDHSVFQPATSPPLTGTLAISKSYMMEPLFVWLLGLPNGIRFQKFKFVWRWERDIPFVAALVKACSNTIEHVDLNSGAKLEVHPVLIDFSKATKLTNVVLRSELSIMWVVKALKTITTKHRDLREVTIHIDFCNIPMFLKHKVYALWMDLDRLLVQLSAFDTVRVRVRCWSSSGVDEEIHEYVEGLLSEATNGGGTKLLYYKDL